MKVCFLIWLVIGLALAGVGLADQIYNREFRQISACKIIYDFDQKKIATILSKFKINSSQFVYSNFINKENLEIQNSLKSINDLPCENRSSSNFTYMLFNAMESFFYLDSIFNEEIKWQKSISQIYTRLNFLIKNVEKGKSIEKIYLADLKKICNLKHQHQILTNYLNTGRGCRRPINTCSNTSPKLELSLHEINLNKNYSLFKKKWTSYEIKEELDAACIDI